MGEVQRIIVTGATGLLGKALCAELRQRGYAITVLSRDPDAARAKVPEAADYIAWQPEETGTWAEAIDGAYGVVNLAGEPLFVFGKRWIYAGVQAVTASRVKGITGLAQAMSQATNKPRVLVSASAVGYYGFTGYTDEEMNEGHLPGTDFWGQNTALWEAATLQAEAKGIRAVCVRTGYVLDPYPGGGLRRQAEQFQRGFGGWILPGKQWLPWIHLEDAANLILLALEDERVRGGLNLTAPQVLRSRDFARTLGRVVGKRAWLPIPQAGIRSQLGVVAHVLTNGRQVVPKKALELGYQFLYPMLEQAMRHLLAAT